MKKKLIKIDKKKGKMLFQSPKGMHDILPEDQFYWEKIRKSTSKISESFNFLRIDTPVVETAEVFERSGKATDIVEKQMYFVKTKGGDKLVLRPEETAPIMRSYIQHNLSKLSRPLKLYYFGPMFRYEQPQFGRFRQFYQAGFEILGGDDDPIYDAQAILTTLRLIEELKIKNLSIQINSIGCKQCRPGYVKKLQEFYKDKKDEICKDCRKRMINNPLRLLDCKNEKCGIIKLEAPIILDRLCAGCKSHLKSVLEYLDELSLFYSLNPYLVRGLDYYNRTVFEIFIDKTQVSGADVSQKEEQGKKDKNRQLTALPIGLALAAGGRYDYLAEMLGGGKLSAVGGSVGVERLIEVMKAQGLGGIIKPEPQVFIVHIGEEAKKKSLNIFENLRQAGIKVTESFGKESLKSQLRVADKVKSFLSLILGQREVFEETVIIRNMRTGTQETVPIKKVVEEVKKRLK
ncbi:MAG: histidine--tRNA ligase [Patescibacteria group bacterium]